MLIRAAILIFFALPVYAQYAGPAILARGEAPATMAESQIRFQPFATFSVIYDTGLATVAVTDQGNLATGSSYGLGASWGVSGTHAWAHTKIGLNYRGNADVHSQKTYYNAVNQALLLGISHQFSRHTILALRESAGYFSRNFGLTGLNEAVPFDPGNSLLPATDFFDNRTAYLTTQADFTLQKSTRLSFNIGADGVVNRRQSAALYGVVGAIARGDVQYRLSRKSTIGGGYHFTYFDYTGIFGGTAAHSFTASYSLRLTRRVEFSAYGGGMRVESKFIQTVPVDPVIVALLGIQGGQVIVHRISWTPDMAFRLSRTFSHGVAYLTGRRGITPGNGLFLTSYMTSASAGYTYTGRRRWSLGGSVGYTRSESVGNITGLYSGFTGELSVTRTLRHGLSVVASYSGRQYHSPDFSNYNRFIYQSRLGIAFSPGETPLRIW